MFLFGTTFFTVATTVLGDSSHVDTVGAAAVTVGKLQPTNSRGATRAGLGVAR